MDTRSGASASRRGRRIAHGRKRKKKAPDTATSAARGSSNTDTPCAQYAPRTAPLGSPDLKGFALPTHRGSPPTGPTTTGCASDPEALAPGASTNGDGARSTTLWPVEPSGEVITPTPAAPAERTPSGAGTTGQDILGKEDLWQRRRAQGCDRRVIQNATIFLETHRPAAGAGSGCGSECAGGTDGGPAGSKRRGGRRGQRKRGKRVCGGRA